MIFLLAFRNLWRNRRRTLIALTALVIGTFMVVGLNGLRNGVVDLMTQGMVEATTGAFQVHRKGFVEAIEAAPLKLNFGDTPALREKILSVAGVKDVAPRISFLAMASTGTVSSMVMVIAPDPGDDGRVFPLAARFVAGTNIVQSPLPNAAVVAGPLLSSLRLKAGDTFTVLSQSPEGQANALDVQIEGWIPLVDPIIGKRLMTMKLSYAQKLLQMDGRITEYAVKVHDNREIDAVAARVRQALGPEYEVHTWLELTPLYRDVIARMTFVLSSVSIVLFIIVFIGIVNVMVMSVFERVREIGTMMALGLRRAAILRLFLVEASLLGVVGGGLGAGVGTLLVRVASLVGVPFKSPGSAGTMPMHPSSSSLFFGAVVAIAAVGAVAAALYPAVKAARMRPVEALRAV